MADKEVLQGGYMRVHLHPKRFHAAHTADWTVRNVWAAYARTPICRILRLPDSQLGRSPCDAIMLLRFEHPVLSDCSVVGCAVQSAAQYSACVDGMG